MLMMQGGNRDDCTGDVRMLAEQRKACRTESLRLHPETAVGPRRIARPWWWIRTCRVEL